MSSTNLGDPEPFPISRAGVVGAGTMGAGIAMTFANAGIPVKIVDASPEALERARALMESTYGALRDKGRLDDAEAAARLARITPASGLEELADADIAIEAVFEDLRVKCDVFTRLGGVMRHDAILATNTSTLSIDAIAAAAPRPARTVGLHFFSPAHIMRLLEVVRGEETHDLTVDAAVALGTRLGKIPIVVGNCDGFVGNRMLLCYRREAEFAVLAGAPPEQVDRALRDFGFAMGPFAVADLAGIDIGYSAKLERIKRGAQPPFTVTNLPDALVAAGRLGQKTGAGFYRYEPGDRTPHPDATIGPIFDAERHRLQIERRPIDDAEIVERCVFALVNEGARILAEEMASSAADIDAIWVNGYGFPEARGGPMKYADDIGLKEVARRVHAYAELDAAFWRPAHLLRELAAHGGSFYDYIVPS